jgi:enamine deaminase RidA (YjgF/YER057c/UK114 family)
MSKRQLLRAQQAVDFPNRSTGTWAQGYRVGDLVFLQGQTGLTLDGELVGAGDPAAQARQAIDNIEILLAQAGATLADVVKIVVYVTDYAYRPRVYPILSERFPDPKPCSTGLVVSGLALPELTVEIDAWAVVGSGAESKGSPERS